MRTNECNIEMLYKRNVCDRCGPSFLTAAFRAYFHFSVSLIGRCNNYWHSSSFAQVGIGLNFFVNMPALLLSVVSKYTLCFSIAQFAVFTLRLLHEYAYNYRGTPKEPKSRLWLHTIGSLALVILTALLLHYSIAENENAVPILITVVNASWGFYQVWRVLRLK